MATGKSQLKRYQLMWKPSFPYTRNDSDGPRQRMYVIGEKRKYIGDTLETSGELTESVSQDPDTFSVQEIIRVAYNSTLVIPFNTSIALAQEYTPQIKNKLVKYETLGGNSVTTFGQAIKQIGLRIKIIKAGRLWETYEKGLEAVSYLSANQGRYYGSLYLLGYDMFKDGTETLAGRYQVAIDGLNFSHRSSENTTMNADLQMTVIHDYGNYQAQKHRIWGSL